MSVSYIIAEQLYFITKAEPVLLKDYCWNTQATPAQDTTYSLNTTDNKQTLLKTMRPSLTTRNNKHTSCRKRFSRVHENRQSKYFDNTFSRFVTISGYRPFSHKIS